MGYIPNSSAKALASHSSKLIAAILMDREDQLNPLVDSYNSSFFGELAREIQKNGYDLMLHFIKDYSEINYCLKSWKLAGAVFIGFFDDNIRQIQEDNQIPMVFTDSYSTVRRITNIGIDDFHGGELAAKYFYLKITEICLLLDQKQLVMVLLCIAFRILRSIEKVWNSSCTRTYY